ncbi:importin-4-like [Chelonus insularis]|uniref:importin-4-like n=1 Tax=Chelonus insularis TaxID=460826 RepID=UPI00158EABFD|nr:importin-4-like [Chelonus insularis]
MEIILNKLLSIDNSVIQQGTAELKEAFRKPESTVALGQLIVSSPNTPIRQYAAVLLRKKYSRGDHWSKLPPNIKMELKSILLQGLVNDPEQIVKNAIAQLIGIIVKYELPNNSWPEIFQIIQQLASSSNMVEKELAMFTLSRMTDVAPSVYLAHAQALITLLDETYRSLQSLGNPTAFYIVKTMQNLSCLVEGNQMMVNAYNHLIPLAINIIQALVPVDESKTTEAMELFDELCDHAPSTVSIHAKNIVSMCLPIARNKFLSDELKMKAIELINSTIKVKPRTIVANKLVEPIIDALFEIMSGPPDNEADEIYISGDDVDNTTIACAVVTLVEMATRLKPEKLVPLLIRHIEPSLQGSDPCAKKAAFLTAAALSEGCSDYVRTKYLDIFLKCTCEGIRHESPIVRNAALFALGRFSEYLQPEMSQYAKELLPVLFEYLSQVCIHLKKEKSEPPSIERMFYALETFCENLNDGILPYLPTLMERLFEILNTEAPTSVKELTISAIGATANASQEHIYPYFERIIAVLDSYFMTEMNDENMSILLQSVDTLGVLARTVGGKNFAPLVGKSLDLGLKLVRENDDPDVRKAVYGLFASIATITKKEMAPVLPKVLEVIFQGIQNSEGIITHLKEDEDSTFLFYEDLSDELDEEDIEHTDNEDDEDDNVACYTVSNSFIEEKEEAILALREIALHTEESFLPYLEKAFEETFKLLNYPHENIKRVSVDALTQFCVNFSKINTNEGQQASLKALAIFVPKLSEIIRLENEPTLAIAGLEALAELLKDVKESVLVGQGHKEAIINCVTDILSGKAECQDVGETDDDDEAEQDELLVECAGEVFTNFGKILTPEEFAIYFQTILPYLKERLKDNKSESQQSFAIGTLAECLSGLKHMTSTFVPLLFNLFKKMIRDSCPEVRNNAYYGLGELAFWGKDSMYPYYSEILQLLAGALHTEEHAGPRDNMVGVIARLIITNYSLADVDRVFPVFVQQLPLKQDYEEYKSVFKSILTLYKLGHEVIKPHIYNLLKISINILYEKHVPDEETKNLITEFINSAQQDFPNEWHTVFSELTPELQHILSC